MQPIRGIIQSLLTAILLAGATAHAATTQLYVSPAGNDTNAGTQEEPFASIAAARDAVRALIAGGLQGDIVVHLRGGTYRVSEAIEFGPGDGHEKFNITYAAYRNEKVTISGGVAITGWVNRESGVLIATLPANLRDWRFRELFVGGRRATRARHPDTGWLRVEKVGTDQRTNFTFAAGDIPDLPHLDQAELVFLHDWSISRIGVKSVDQTSRTLTTRNNVGCNARHFAMAWFEKQPRYALEGLKAFADTPGEWHQGAAGGTVTYISRLGETGDNIKAVAPRATALIKVTGTLEKPLHNLHFKGIRFAHCAFALPAKGWAAGQATFHENRDQTDTNPLRGIMPAAITFDHAANCTVTDSTIEQLGSSGIWFRTACRDCAVIGCRVRDVSGNGVMFGEDSNRRVDGRTWWQAAPEQIATGNVLRNSVVEHCGKQFFGAVGVWVGLTAGTRIEHNEIRHLPYTGVSMGWRWNPDPTPCRDNRIERNHIHHVMQVLSDGGGIYTLGRQPGSILRGNHIHDVPLNAGRAESNGMFLDEGTTDFVIEGNLIYAIDKSPLRFHKATTNLVRGNVMATQKRIPLVRYNATDPKNIKLQDNWPVAAGTDPAGHPIARAAGLQPPYRQRLQAGN